MLYSRLALLSPSLFHSRLSPFLVYLAALANEAARAIKHRPVQTGGSCNRGNEMKGQSSRFLQMQVGSFATARLITEPKHLAADTGTREESWNFMIM